MEDEIKSNLLIIDFDCRPEEITEVIGLKPTQVVMKGEIKSKDPDGTAPPILHKNNVWALQSDIPSNLNFDDHLELVLRRLEPKAGAIAQIARKYKGELSIYGFAHDATRKAINVPREQLRRLAELNVDLDVDIYPLAD